MKSYGLENSPIDLSTVRVIVISWPDGHWNKMLRNWIRARFWKRLEHPDDQIIDVIRADQNCAKNWAVKEHVIDNPGSYKHFLFVERDVMPDLCSDNIFRVEADVVCCQTKCHNEAAWLHPTDFHSAMWMSTRSALERIPPPWFGIIYNEDGTSRLGAECEYFKAKADAAGLTIARGGWADHAAEGTWCG